MFPGVQDNLGLCLLSTCNYWQCLLSHSNYPGLNAKIYGYPIIRQTLCYLLLLIPYPPIPWTSRYHSLPATHHDGLLAGPLTLQAKGPFLLGGMLLTQRMAWFTPLMFQFLFNCHLVLRHSLATDSKISIFSPFLLFFLPILLFSSAVIAYAIYLVISHAYRLVLLPECKLHEGKDEWFSSLLFPPMTGIQQELNKYLLNE